jgi:hypothetical protein
MSTQYRERLPLNVYDSISLGLIKTSGMRLFGSANVGNVRLSNLQYGGQLVGGDQNAMLQNWYARTDINLDGAARDAWSEWTNGTITLIVGSMPVHQIPLADLLARKEGQRNWAGRLTLEDLDGTNAPQREFAKITFERHDAMMAKTRHIDARSWNQLSGHDQATWLDTVEFVRSTLEAPLLAYVPQRQNCFVHIEFAMAKLGRLLEVAADIKDRLIWVHLEGIMCRGV